MNEQKNQLRTWAMAMSDAQREAWIRDCRGQLRVCLPLDKDGWRSMLDELIFVQAFRRINA